jgi:hypothetical protein
MGIETWGGFRHFRLNPDVVRNIDLPGLDEVDVVVLQVAPPQPFLFRCVEEVMFHLMGTSITAGFAFIAGFLYGQ